MSFSLSELTKYSDIVIQCHDNPDADALASGFALKWYLRLKGKAARFIYSGKKRISKSNLVLMINQLGIDVDYVSVLDAPELLVLVDCQYGENNVTRFDAKNIAIIDHHQVLGEPAYLNEIRSRYGSCSTIIYRMMKDEGIDINQDVKLATALYYGLMTDTNSFSEISHPSDKDLRDFAAFSQASITLFRNSNISKEELKIAGEALEKAHFPENKTFGIVEAEPCDPNILGIISDMLLEVDSIETGLVYSCLPFGVKISVRSCVKEVKASELAAYLCEGYGGGGGHLIKAGGFLQRELIEADGIPFEKDAIRQLLRSRMESYYANSEIIYAGTHKEDIHSLKHYVKREMEVGYVPVSSFSEPGKRILIRTLEGDVDVMITEDINIIIGIEGEIYPCRKNKFEASYITEDTPYVYPGEYPPTVIDSESGERISLLPFAKSCRSKGGAGIYARKLEKRVKVFTTWDPEKYYLGVPGDYLAVRVDDLSDIYVISGKLFDRSYEEK